MCVLVYLALVYLHVLVYCVLFSVLRLTKLFKSTLKKNNYLPRSRFLLGQLWPNGCGVRLGIGGLQKLHYVNNKIISNMSDLLIKRYSKHCTLQCAANEFLTCYLLLKGQVVS